jgi:hypothetical protein
MHMRVLRAKALTGAYGLGPPVSRMTDSMKAPAATPSPLGTEKLPAGEPEGLGNPSLMSCTRLWMGRGGAAAGRGV